MKHFWRKPGKTLIYVLSLFMTIGLLGIPVYAQGTENENTTTGNESNQPVTNTNGNDETNTVTNGQNQGTDTTGGTGSQAATPLSGSIKAAIPEAFTELTAYLAKQGNEGKLTIDIYQVATAAKDPNYDSYPFTAGTTFTIPTGKDLNKMGTKNTDGSFSPDRSDWEELAQNFAKQVRDNPDIASTPYHIVYGSNDNSEVVPYGLYLVLARGTDLTQKKQYFKELEPETTPSTTDTAGGTGSAQEAPKPVLCTIMESDTKTFYFTPFLVAIPNKAETITEDSKITTADSGEWKPNVTVYLKPSPKPLYGNLKIVKTVTTQENRIKVTPMTAVFRITGKDAENNTIYSNVASITIPSEEYVILEHIPVGTVITVEEVYTGAGYIKTDGPTPETVTIQKPTSPNEDPATDEKTVTVSFEDTYHDELKKGYGIMNIFTKTDGEQAWNVVPANRGGEER